MSAELTYLAAARSALNGAMTSDERVVVLGEDVGEGGPFGFTKHLASQFGEDRIRNTPISEGGVMGAAIGMALGGMHPLVDLMFNDFVTLASDQLFNHAAKLHFMSGGRLRVPLTIWTVGGAGTRWGAQHSQHLEGWLAQVPGLKVLAPSDAASMAAAMGAALEADDPVVVFADRSLLYRRDGDTSGRTTSPWRSRIVKEGTDVTLATWGRLVPMAYDLAVSHSSASVEVIDLQVLAPLDIETILQSVGRTGRLLIVHEGSADGSLGDVIAARVAETGFWSLDAPIRRLSPPATPVPAAPNLENSYMIREEQILATLEELMAQ